MRKKSNILLWLVCILAVVVFLLWNYSVTISTNPSNDVSAAIPEPGEISEVPESLDGMARVFEEGDQLLVAIDGDTLLYTIDKDHVKAGGNSH